MRGVFEGILVSSDGYVTEGASTNIFIVKGERVLTPPSFLGALEGITRKVVLEILERLEIELKIMPFTSYDLYTADEVFLTNTGIEIMPVRAIDKRIIKEAPGKITQLLRREFLKERGTT
jgi:branched-chain amino acid aminotransferase